MSDGVLEPFQTVSTVPPACEVKRVRGGTVPTAPNCCRRRYTTRLSIRVLSWRGKAAPIHTSWICLGLKVLPRLMSTHAAQLRVRSGT